MRQDQMYSISSETKKEYIVRLAKEDPFLKIEEISKLAKTTPRYVRTILSEANLSLMNLREEYARKMEKYSESKIVFSLKDSLANIHGDSKDDTSRFTYSAPKVEIIKNTRDFHWINDNSPLYRYMQYVYYCQKLLGVIVFNTQIWLNEDELTQEKAIFYLLGLNTEEVRFTSPEIEIGRFSDCFDSDMSDFEFSFLDSIIMITTTLTVKERILGEEVFYFPSEYIKLTIPGLFSPYLELAKD